MKWNRMSVDEAVDHLRDESRLLVAVSDRQGLKRLYARLAAAAYSGDDANAHSRMQNALREVLTEPLRQVRRGLFDRL